jgi:hypothetical protein
MLIIFQTSSLLAIYAAASGQVPGLNADRLAYI